MYFSNQCFVCTRNEENRWKFHFLGCHSFAFSFFWLIWANSILNRRYLTGKDKDIEPSDSQNDKMIKMRIGSYEYGYPEIHYIVTINISPYNHAFTSFDFFLLHRYTTHFHLHPYCYVTNLFLPFIFYFTINCLK